MVSSKTQNVISYLREHDIETEFWWVESRGNWAKIACSYNTALSLVLKQCLYPRDIFNLSCPLALYKQKLPSSLPSFSNGLLVTMQSISCPKVTTSFLKSLRLPNNFSLIFGVKMFSVSWKAAERSLPLPSLLFRHWFFFNSSPPPLHSCQFSSVIPARMLFLHLL